MTTLLGRSILFEHDAPELDLWLAALPRARPTGDERGAVLRALDAGVQECLRDPYKYVEHAGRLVGEGSAAYGPRTLPSPLLAVLLELLARGQVDEDAVLPMVGFVRRLAVGLLGKQPDVAYVEGLAGKLEKDVDGMQSDPHVAVALRREVALLQSMVESLRSFQSNKLKASKTAAKRLAALLEEVPPGQLTVRAFIPDHSALAFQMTQRLGN